MGRIDRPGCGLRNSHSRTGTYLLHIVPRSISDALGGGIGSLTADNLSTLCFGNESSSMTNTDFGMTTRVGGINARVRPSALDA